MSLNEEQNAEEQLQSDSVTDFAIEESNGFAVESGDDLEKSEANNPLGLSDKDVQLEYDHDPEAEGEQAHSAQMPPSQTDDNPSQSSADEIEHVEMEDQPRTPAADMFDDDMEKAVFGESVSDDEDAEPAGEPEGSQETTEQSLEQPLGGDDDDDDKMSHTGSIKSDDGNDKVSDFDIMMQKKSEERRRAYRRRKRGQDVDLINDHDDQITALIGEMKAAAESDRASHEKRECAIKKITMLPRVVNLLRKHDLQTALLDCGILSALADWLAPLPDGNLTHVKIRESILKILAEMSTITPEQLKNSGIGKAVMLLYKHPKELKENRSKAGKLIQEWSRPIFGTSTNYKSLSREEREERDMELMNKRRTSLDQDRYEDEEEDDDEDAYRTPKKRRTTEGSAKTPEDDPNKNIPRARVPQPSLRDYVIRPKSNIAMDSVEGTRKSSSSKTVNRFEKRFRGMKEQQRSAKGLKGAQISLEGRRL